MWHTGSQKDKRGASLERRARCSQTQFDHRRRQTSCVEGSPPLCKTCLDPTHSTCRYPPAPTPTPFTAFDAHPPVSPHQARADPLLLFKHVRTGTARPEPRASTGFFIRTCELSAPSAPHASAGSASSDQANQLRWSTCVWTRWKTHCADVLSTPVTRYRAASH